LIPLIYFNGHHREYKFCSAVKNTDPSARKHCPDACYNDHLYRNHFICSKFSKLLRKIFGRLLFQRKKECGFSKLFWKMSLEEFEKILQSTSLVLHGDGCVIKRNLQKKYAMLTLSLDVIWDVICYLHNAAVKN